VGRAIHSLPENSRFFDWELSRTVKSKKYLLDIGVLVVFLTPNLSNRAIRDAIPLGIFCLFELDGRVIADR
jgi:hypothetical protein